MDPNQTREVKDPEVHTEPSPDVTGYPDDQNIDAAQVESGLAVADDEARDRAALDADEDERP